MLVCVSVWSAELDSWVLPYSQTQLLELERDSVMISNVFITAVITTFSSLVSFPHCSQSNSKSTKQLHPRYTHVVYLIQRSELSWSMRPLWSWCSLLCKTVKTIPHRGVWMHWSFSAMFWFSVGLSTAPSGTCSFVLKHFQHSRLSIRPLLSTQLKSLKHSSLNGRIKTRPSSRSLLWKYIQQNCSAAGAEKRGLSEVMRCFFCHLLQHRQRE